MVFGWGIATGALLGHALLRHDPPPAIGEERQVERGTLGAGPRQVPYWFLHTPRGRVVGSAPKYRHVPCQEGLYFYGKWPRLTAGVQSRDEAPSGRCSWSELRIGRGEQP